MAEDTNANDKKPLNDLKEYIRLKVSSKVKLIECHDYFADKMGRPMDEDWALLLRRIAF